MNKKIVCQNRKASHEYFIEEIYEAGMVLLGPETEVLLDGLLLALEPGDATLLLAKGLGMGVVVAWFCCHHGLEVQGSPTEVPQRASRAVVTSLLACFVLSIVVSIVFYASGT